MTWSGGPLLGVPLPGKPLEGSSGSRHHQQPQSLLGRQALGQVNMMQRPSVLAKGQIKWVQADLCLARLDPGEGETGMACPPLHRPVPPGQSP